MVSESCALLQNDVDSVEYNLVVPVPKHNAMKACGGHEAGPHMLVLGTRQR
jgi:hypothetical protein